MKFGNSNLNNRINKKTTDHILSNFIAKHRQIVRLQERRMATKQFRQINGFKLRVDPGVYRTGIDTELMIDCIKTETSSTFLEVGCGTGAISLHLAKKTKQGVAADINILAVRNTEANRKLLGVTNLEVIESDVFNNINGCFDIVVCNPPYNNYSPSDDIDRMFWDQNNEMKLRFFKEVCNYVYPGGRIYFGWANFADLDFHFPIRQAQVNGLKLESVHSKVSEPNGCSFLVYEFSREMNS